MRNRSGSLLLIATPIGNLGDLSPRAVEALKSCDLLLCEDTRHTRKLLSAHGIDVPLESFHEHNEDEKAPAMIDRVLAGERLGIVSDAGVPLISDPGFALIRLAREKRVKVEPIPGASSVVMAVAVSGIPPSPFAFFGFAPHRHGARLEFYRTIASHRMTAVIYESPLRLIDSMRDAREVLGNVPATIAREMTKIHEEFIHGTLDEVLAGLTERDSIRGELTIVLGAAIAEKQAADPAILRADFERLRGEGMRRNDAVKLLAERYRMRKNDIYAMLIEETAPPSS